jgi:hypothetical protein
VPVGANPQVHLVTALRLYAEAARVASSYTYEADDSLQLLKTTTKMVEPGLASPAFNLAPQEIRGG